MEKNEKKEEKAEIPYWKDLVIPEKSDNWNICFEKYKEGGNKTVESLCVLGNGLIGQRGSFEEDYGGEKLIGNYYAKIWYPDRTRINWWKQGYPRFYPKMINFPNWLKLSLKFDGTLLDLNSPQIKVKSLYRILHMHDGYLERNFEVNFIEKNSSSISVNTKRFVSMANRNSAALEYEILSKDFSGFVEISSILDCGVINEGYNYESDKFWFENYEIVNKKQEGFVMMQTKELKFSKDTKKKDFKRYKDLPSLKNYIFNLAAGMTTKVFKIDKNGKKLEILPQSQETSQKIKFQNSNSETEETKIEKALKNSPKFDFNLKIEPGEKIIIYKFYSTFADQLKSKEKSEKFLYDQTKKNLRENCSIGFDELFKRNIKEWNSIWKEKDIIIEGCDKSQQGIRFCLYNMFSSCVYSKEEANITPKGFTGEKYGVGNYWDVDAFDFIYFLLCSPINVAKNLLLKRYDELENAKVNAEILGYKIGSALYPMVSMNGEECHNEWEITFEEIHRNAAVCRSLWQYYQFTNDNDYMIKYGFPVLISIAKFYADRVNFSEDKKKFVILGVTGPNEFENNTNNNYYTNRMAKWVLEWTLEMIEILKKHEKFDSIKNFFNDEDVDLFGKIVKDIYLPFDEKKKILLQKDGFLDKEIITVEKFCEKSKLSRPLWKGWSWDRILRKCFIKQADTLQALCYFEKKFREEFKDDSEFFDRNFDFYEPITVHESSLSACMHCILGSKLGIKRKEQVSKFFLMATRYSLDNYNFDTCDGAHVTAMGGGIMAFLELAGLNIENGKAIFKNPYMCNGWKKIKFNFYNSDGKKYCYEFCENDKEPKITLIN